MALKNVELMHENWSRHWQVSSGGSPIIIDPCSISKTLQEIVEYTNHHI